MNRQIADISGLAERLQSVDERVADLMEEIKAIEAGLSSIAQTAKTVERVADLISSALRDITLIID